MKVIKYDNGLTLIVEPIAALRSVTAGIMVGAGSAYETAENNGISHFIEHVQFKGTARRSSEDIVSEFDRAGASYNAFTGKEYTCFYFKSIDEQLERCFDVLSDLFLHSQFDPKELDRERKVIIEEINMSLDEPDGVCYDTLYRTAFDGSLGMEILGTKQNVLSFGREHIEKYKAKNYLPSNTVVAFVGNITAERAQELMDKYMSELIAAPYAEPVSLSAQKFVAGSGRYIHDYEQSELAVSYPALVRGDDRAYTLSALDSIFGGGMSSRLFQRLREKMGIVYSVYSSPWFGKANGLFTVFANVNVSNVESSVRAVKEEIEKLVKFGVTDDETEKAKMQLKVAAVFGKENPMTYMLALMRTRLITGKDYDVDAITADIDAVTSADINKMIAEIFSREPAFAYAGKKPARPLDEIYREKSV